MRILEIKFERNWDFEELFESSGFLRKTKLRKLGLWELNFERNQNSCSVFFSFFLLSFFSSSLCFFSISSSFFRLATPNCFYLLLQANTYSPVHHSANASPSQPPPWVSHALQPHVHAVGFFLFFSFFSERGLPLLKEIEKNFIPWVVRKRGSTHGYIDSIFILIIINKPMLITF